VLNVWDRQADADSRGAVLFAFWAEAIDFDNLFANPGRSLSTDYAGRLPILLVR